MWNEEGVMRNVPRGIYDGEESEGEWKEGRVSERDEERRVR